MRVYGVKSQKLYAKLLEAQSEPVPAACINKQQSSGSPSRSLLIDQLYVPALVDN